MFWITHEHRTADLARARKQIPIVKSILRHEHVDPKFTDHLKSYDLDDWDFKVAHYRILGSGRNVRWRVTASDCSWAFWFPLQWKTRRLAGKFTDDQYCSASESEALYYLNFLKGNASQPQFSGSLALLKVKSHASEQSVVFQANLARPESQTSDNWNTLPRLRKSHCRQPTPRTLKILSNGFTFALNLGPSLAHAKGKHD
jgi:hypothetical protein